MERFFVILFFVFLCGCSGWGNPGSHHPGPYGCPVTEEGLESCVKTAFDNFPKDFPETQLAGAIHEVTAGCLLSGGLNPQTITQSDACKPVLEAVRDKYIKAKTL